jgi:hypothetical protein
MKHARNDGPDLAFRLARRVVATVADDMSTVQRVGAGIAAALVAMTPFGAWSEVEAQADPLSAGKPVEIGPFEVTVVKAATADDLGYLVPQPGNHMLAVVVDVTNTGEVPEYTVTLGDAIPAPRDAGIVPDEPLADLGPGTDTGTADGGSAAAGDGVAAEPSASAEPSGSAGPEEPELPSASIVNIEDGTSISIFNPGVTHRVALIWEQSGDWSEKTLPLEMVELEWVEKDPQGLDDGHWFPNEVAFRGEIPVRAAKPAADAARTDADGRPADGQAAGEAELR